jgi:hypothetical protein
MARQRRPRHPGCRRRRQAARAGRSPRLRTRCLTSAGWIH